MNKFIPASLLILSSYCFAQDEYAFDDSYYPENECCDDDYIAYEENAEQCENCGWINYYWDDYVEDAMDRETAWPGKREDSFYDYIIR